MARLALLAAVLALPLAASAAPTPRVEGRIESDGARTEILGQPVQVGQRIELPEGFLQVEEEGSEDGEVGSFTVVSAEAFAALAPVPERMGEATDPAAAAPDVTIRCRAERAAYLAELWKQSGIDFKDPVALFEGLEAGDSGPRTGYYWFALQTDPFRPLAWSFELRNRADALARCIRGE